MRKKLLLFLALWLTTVYCKVSAVETSVDPSTLATAYADAADGDVLLLGAGTYSTAVAFPTGKAVTLKADPAAATQPEITFQLGEPTGAGGSITFDGLYINRGASYFFSTATNYALGAFNFKNCLIKNITSSLMSVTGTTGSITSISLDNCLISGNGTTKVSFIAPSQIVRAFTLKNSTLYNYTGGDFFHPSTASSAASITVIVQNNNFYKSITPNGYGICSVAGSGYSNASTFTFTNNICDQGYSGTPILIYVKVGGGTVVQTNNLLSSFGSGTISAGSGFTFTKTISNLTLGSGVLASVSSIPYTNAAGGDLSIPSDSPLATAGVNGACLGAPRWIKTVSVPVTVSTVVSPSGAGTASPASSTVNQGDIVALTATQGFGYRFLNWTTSDGTIVSTSTSFQTAVSSTISYTANFSQINTYSLDLTISGGANSYMVAISPAGTTVNGKLMYEEGTAVTLTASSNSILTFTNWSTGETGNTLSYTMNQNQGVSAVYSAKDYIVGWDFYKSGGSSRVADFYSTSDNQAVTLNLRNAAGTTAGWLDKSTLAASGYYGYGAAVNWKTPTEQYYYQTSFNAKDFVDIKVAAGMLYNYGAWKTQNCEYSLDGTNFTLLGTYSLDAGQTWYSKSFSLPSDANNASKVYIRWIPDYTGTYNGTDQTTDKDGTSISNIFITGTILPVPDNTPPVLTESIPSSSTITASATGNVVLTFDEKVMLSASSTVTATLGNKTLTPTVSGKSVLFPYSGLEYSTSYTFTLPEYSISDLSGNYLASTISITFTTMTRPTVTKKLFDFVVGVDGNFKAAITAATTASSSGERFRIFFPNGDYNIGASTGDANQMTTISLPNISYIGESSTGVRLYNQNTTEGIGLTATMYFTSAANNQYLQDLSLYNKDYRSGSSSLGRCVALWDQGTKNIYKNVNVLSNQDTYYTGAGRTFFDGGSIHGTVDFICGGGDIFFNESLLYLENRTGDCITAPSTTTNWGYVFNNCTIDGFSTCNGNYSLGRPWQNSPKSVYLNTKMNILPSAGGWGDMSVVPGVFAEYNSTTADGTVIDLSTRRTSWTVNSVTYPVSTVLTTEQAAQYTLDNVLGGSDAWQPKLYTEQSDAPVISFDGTTISWNDNSYVLCWAICKNGNFVSFTTSTSYTVPASATNGTVYTVRAANEMGGLGLASNPVTVVKKNATTINWTTPNAIVTGTALSSTQLNATAVGNTSTAVYDPAIGTILTPGTYNLKVYFAEDANYWAGSQTVSLEVKDIQPSTVSCNTPSPIAYGAALSSAQFNASVIGTTGAVTYSPALGTILNAGTNTITITYASDGIYAAASISIEIFVNKATPIATWNTPVAINYGTSLSATQLNASVQGNGTATYTPALGEKLNAGTHTLSVEFAESTNYLASSASVNLLVNKVTPVVTWTTPDAITFGTLLSNSQLNASVEGNASATYTPTLGEKLNAGIQSLHVDFAESTNYLASSKTIALIVNKAEPSITWNSPSAITYGTVLSESQLNASIQGNGTATYSPALGEKLDAGTQTLNVSFVESTNYLANSASVQIEVYKATPSVSWTTPNAIVYGTLLSSLQLNASVDGNGAATYNYAIGEKLNAGTYSLTVDFAESKNYLSASASTQLTVNKAVPVIEWNDPEPITLNSGLSSVELNASTSGTTSTAVYNPSLGTVLSLGTHILTVSYNADANYEAASKTVTIVVTDKIIPTIDWNNPTAITYGTVLSSTELNATAPSSLTAVYTPALGTKLDAGTHTLYAYFAGNATYESVTKTVTIEVNKAVPSIDWTTPAAITYGTALSATQLNATVTGNGTATYTPSTGTLNAGTQTLRVDFAESTNYLAASQTVSLVINKATPTITWATPSAITYGTALSATQLNASVEGNGTATYTPSTGTLNAGTQTLRVDFAESTNYLAASKTVSLVINKATPIVSWTTPSAITYGTALSATQLNASVTGNGTATYTPSTGTLNAGTQTLRVDFAESTNYLATSKTVSLVVNKATPTVSWATPSAITYGTALSATQLNASVEGNGTATYAPSTGTLNAGTQTLRVDFAESTNYLAASKTVSLVVNKATPTVSWATPSAITYGTALSATQLNASVEGNGSATYTPSTGTLNAGTQTLRVDFAESTNYLAASKTISLVVNKATPTVSWATPSAITYGTALSATQLNASVTGNGTATYTPSTGTLNAGTQTLRVDFAESTNYLAASKTVSLVINKATPTVSWATPSAITYGTALSATQLNATVTGNGTATYTPSTGTLNAGTQTLRVDFAESVNYLAASKTVSLVVNKATPTVSWATPSAITYGTALSATQLNASVTGNGTATYTPSTGTLNAGTQTLRVDFAESTNYLAASITVSLVISKATPTVSWSTPSAITYGTALSATQLNASVTGNGTATYTPSTGTLNAGTQTLRVDFAESTNYLAASKTVSLVVNKATPTITWATPATITYGTALSATQLNASVDGNGTAIYTPASGILNAGTQTLRVDFAESANYLAASKTVGLVISKIAPSVSWSTPAAITYGTALSATQLNASVDGNGDATYTPASGILNAGTQTLGVDFAESTNYLAASKTVSLVINKAVPSVSWVTPAAITYGTALNATQLNASAVASSGIVSYSSVSGTILTAGTQAITVTYAADNNYEAASKSVSIVVNKAVLIVSASNLSRVYGDENPTLAISYTGLVNNDKISSVVLPIAACAANAKSEVGYYDITLSGGSASNYSLSLEKGILTVTKAILKVAARNAEMMKGASLPQFKLVFEGFKNSDDSTLVSGSASFSVNMPESESVGDVYNISVDVTGLSATNYSFAASSTFGKLTIVRNTAVGNIDGVRLSMYPNPTKGLVKIVVPQEYEGAVITVTSISGSVVLSQKLESAETALDFSNLPIGNYLVRVSTSKGIVVKQLVKF